MDLFYTPPSPFLLGLNTRLVTAFLTCSSDTFGSGTTGGAGFGNKNAPDPTVDYDDSDLRFDSHGETGAYKGEKTSGRHGSGSTAGAGFGNKTGSMEKHGKFGRVDLWAH
jgi:hypothetical protein